MLDDGDFWDIVLAEIYRREERHEVSGLFSEMESAFGDVRTISNHQAIQGLAKKKKKITHHTEPS
jgi:predicted secreted Zn-dependent protease